MSHLLSQSSQKDIQNRLKTFKEIQQFIQYKKQTQKQIISKDVDLSSLYHQNGYKKQQLEKMLDHIRFIKLKQTFLQKLERVSIHKQPVSFNIYDEKQQNQNRILKFKGFVIKQKILSTIYLTDLLFVLATLVISAWRAFLPRFESDGAHNTLPVIIILIITLAITTIKIIVQSISIKFQEGSSVIYLTDILMNNIYSVITFVDITYAGVVLGGMCFSNQSAELGFVTFILAIIKIVTLYDKFKVIESTFVDSFRKQNFWNLTKVVLFNLFFVHFIGSILLAMARINDTQNWIVSNGIDIQIWYAQYIWALYWASTMIMTVGFGDLSATNFRQALVVGFLELFSCIVLAYNISQIGMIVSAIKAPRNEYNKKISIFKRMAKQDQIQQQLQRRIQSYLRQDIQIRQKYQFNLQNELLQSIPQHLRNEYIMSSNKNIFPNLPFFKNLQKKTLLEFVNKFRSYVYYPGEMLAKFDQENQTILILKSGRVGLTYKKYGSHLNGTIVQQIEIIRRKVVTHNAQHVHLRIPIILNNDFLSQNSSTNHNIIALDYSLVLHLDYSDFFDIIKNSQIDFSYYFSIKHKHSLIENEFQQVVCEYCSRYQMSQTVNQNQSMNEKKLYFHHQTGNINEFRHNTNQKIEPDMSHHQHITIDSNVSLKINRIKSQMHLDKIKYHTRFQCPKLHYFPLKNVIIMRYIQNKGKIQQANRKYLRKKKRSNQSLALRKIFFQPFQTKNNFSYIQLKKQHFKQKTKHFFNFTQQKFKQKSQQSQKTQHQWLQQFLNKKFQQFQRKQQIHLQKIFHNTLNQYQLSQKLLFWGLQIDIMHNYKNYFPSSNIKNYESISLRQIKNVKKNYQKRKRIQ